MREDKIDSLNVLGLFIYFIRECLIICCCLHCIHNVIFVNIINCNRSELEKKLYIERKTTKASHEQLKESVELLRYIKFILLVSFFTLSAVQ